MSDPGDINSLRRSYLMASRDAELVQDYGLAEGLRALQRAQPGTSLPPSLAATVVTKLAAAGYTAREDLDGADADELTDHGLTPVEATTVLNALS